MYAPLLRCHAARLPSFPPPRRKKRFSICDSSAFSAGFTSMPRISATRYISRKIKVRRHKRRLLVFAMRASRRSRLLYARRSAQRATRAFWRSPKFTALGAMTRILISKTHAHRYHFDGAAMARFSFDTHAIVIYRQVDASGAAGRAAQASLWASRFSITSPRNRGLC